MEGNLISKKELLDLTGISYGQLYRWKRKKLIPEDWFIKKSSFTGQETYFQKDMILERIDKIKNMKEDMSLDDLAGMFSPELKDVFLTKEEIIQKNIVSKTAINIYENYYKEADSFTFKRTVFLVIVEKFLQTGDVGIEEGKAILETLEENYQKFKGRNCEIVLLRKFGIAICILVSMPSEIYIEKGAKVAAKFDILKCIEEVKLKALNN